MSRELETMIQKMLVMNKELEYCQRRMDELKQRVFSRVITPEEKPLLKMELWFFALFATYKQECILLMIRHIDQINTM